MNIGKHFRQGDVLLMEVDAIPATAKKLAADKRGIVLMEGEKTGHHHRFLNNGDVSLHECGGGGERFVTVEKASPLSHEEHTAILFAEGKLQQSFQVEDFGEEIRPVAD